MRIRCLERRGTWATAFVVATTLVIGGLVRGDAVKQKGSLDPAVAASSQRMGHAGDEWWRASSQASGLSIVPFESSPFAEGSTRASDCCSVGGWSIPIGLNTLWAGDAFSIIEPVLLKSIEIEASFNGNVDITFGVYREKENAPVGDYRSLRIKKVTRTGTGRGYYSSGTLGTGGVLLTPRIVNGSPVPTFFLIAAGWSSSPVDSRLDGANYSSGPAFCKGRVWGSWGDSVNPPPPGGAGSDELLGLQYFPTGAISFNMCFEVPGGACCLGDASCVDDVTSNACENELGGEYLGLYTLCALDADECLGFGACCSIGGNCSVSGEAECAGTYKGNGTECNPTVDPCDDTLGACCRYDGSCVEINEYDCELDPNQDIPGVWQGPGVECSEPNEPPTCPALGACCNGLSCTDVAEEDCELIQCVNELAMGGCLPAFHEDMLGECPDVGVPQCVRTTGLTYSPGQPCAFEPCKSEFDLGTCCVLGSCSVDTKLDCLNMGGTFNEAGSNGWHACDMADDFCTVTTGACCLPTDECLVRTPAQCATSNGVFQGYGIGCSAFLCEDGACCYSNIMDEPDCIEVRPLECADTNGLNGRFQGNGTTCPSDCFITGACCFPTGTCKQLAEVECMTSNGTYNGDDTFCALTECPELAACCFTVLGQPQCGVRTEAECALLNNSTWGDPGSTCAPGAATACQVGACCALDSTCTEGLRANCNLKPFGVFNGNLSTCGPQSCPARGACCVPDVDGYSCEVREPADCATNGMVYRGDAEACDDSVCESAPCCLPDGSCEDMLPSECTVAGGVPGVLGDRCDDKDFCTNGACCVDAGGGNLFCLDGVVRALCEANDGSFKGADVPCSISPDICDEFPTACCLPDGSCEDLIASECADRGGSSGTGTELCADADFCTTGACCVDVLGTPTCFPDSTMLDCGAANGVFKGPDSECLPGTCQGSDGACCKTDGTCANLTDVACAAISGAVFQLGETCATATCPDFPAACCEIDGSCTEITSAACSAIGGAVYNAGETCATAGCVDQCGVKVNSDFNGDGSVDLLDYAAFQLCFGDNASAACLCPFDDNGDGVIDSQDVVPFINDFDPSALCKSGDFDGDGDVDLNDYAAFQQCFVPGTDPLCVCAFDLDSSGTVDLVDLDMWVPLITSP